jgi:hypothetical protein
MTQAHILNSARSEPTGYKVDMSRGERIGRVSSEWSPPCAAAPSEA